jgi:hypothetical protein
LGGHKLVHQACAVLRQAVPNDEELAGQMARQVTQEIQQLAVRMMPERGENRNSVW